MESNARVGIRIANHRTMDDRVAAASQCCGALHLQMPLVVDEINDKVGEAYSGFPDRMYLIDREGKVAYKGGRGPFGMQPAELEQSIVMLLADESKLYPEPEPEVGPEPQPEPEKIPAPEGKSEDAAEAAQAP